MGLQILVWLKKISTQNLILITNVKIKNLRLFNPKIRLEQFQDELEYYDWSERQVDKFGISLSTHGLLLTGKDCDFLQSLSKVILHT